MSGQEGNQDKVFLEKEADQWFLRNREALAQADRFDWPMQILENLEGNGAITSFLELGCSNGWRLARLRKRFGEDKIYAGVDPSPEAIKRGQELYQGVEFHRGLLADVPLQRKYGLVIVHYVLHWVGRDSLMQSLAEIDRLVEDGGYLLVGDFLPDHPRRVPYHHLPGQGVFTYKQDYARIFTALGCYSEVLRIAHEHGRTDGSFTAPPSRERGVCCLLKKSLTGYYAEPGR